MPTEIDSIFLQLAEDEWAEFVKEAKLVYRYNYSLFEKGLYISGFTKGIMSGWLIHKKLVGKKGGKIK